MEYRFATVAAPVAYTATVTSPEVTLKTPNVVTEKVLIPITTTITFTMVFAPSTPSNVSYTITPSNGRATVNPDQSVTFNLSTGVGNVSLTITFADTSIAPQIFYFTTTNG